MSYISREEAIKAITDNPARFAFITGNQIAALKKLPTADVVEVVRCKDCKHATFYSCKNDACYRGIICEYQIAIGDENFYCSFGERREE